VLGNGHALFGEGRTEKAWQQDLAGRLLYFVVLHPDQTVIDTAKGVVESWLADMGLTLKPSKTRIAHTLDPLGSEAPGFAFLGFTVRQYRVGKYKSRKGRTGRPYGFKVLITPSKDATQRHYADLRSIVTGGKMLSQSVLITRLNRVIQGWSRYYRGVVAKATYNALDNQMFPLLLRWAKRRHRNKNGRWIMHKYWRTVGSDRWRFAPPEGAALAKHLHMRIQRHVKVRGDASPYDGDLLYWAQRLRHHPLLTGRTAVLLKRQGGACAWCGLLEFISVYSRSSRGGEERVPCLSGHLGLPREGRRTWQDYALPTWPRARRSCWI